MTVEDMPGSHFKWSPLTRGKDEKAADAAEGTYQQEQRRRKGPQQEQRRRERTRIGPMARLELSVDDIGTFNDDQEMDKNIAALSKLGGVDSLLRKLQSDKEKGIPGTEEDIKARRELYGSNSFLPVETATWLELFLESFADSTVIVLIVSAVVSLAAGLYENLATGWIEGAAIMMAVLIVALVTATNNYMKELQFRKLNEVKEEVDVAVLRGGHVHKHSVHSLVVGDVVYLGAGDRVPADGVLLQGSDVLVNESALTGESDDKSKQTDGDVFLFSGTTLVSGACTVVVIAVGPHSRWGKVRAGLAVETPETPLQAKLTVLADQIGYVGMAAAAATFVAMMIVWYLYPEARDPELNLFEYILKAFIMAVTIVVVAVPEGLPLAVTLSLAFSTQKMMRDNNLIRVLAACETMGNATNICSDKTGTLTQNKMVVVEACVGGATGVVDEINWGNEVAKAVIREGIAVNSTAVLEDSSGSVIGNKTEGALLMLMNSALAGGDDYLTLRRIGFQPARGDRLLTFTSARKCMSVVQVLPTGWARVYSKGAAEVLLEKCEAMMMPNGSAKKLTKGDKEKLRGVVRDMASRALRVVSLCHRDITTLEANTCSTEELESKLILDMICGIKDPLRPDVPEAVSVCQSAGIMVRMVTGDNLETAKAIARECGILTDDGLALEGPEFRNMTPKELDAVLPRLQVLARSSPTDKLLLVSRLNGANLPVDVEAWQAAHPNLSWDKHRDVILPGYREEWEASRGGPQGGEVVGVTGDGTNDGPALKAADVGLSMGIAGTDVAKEASDIVILDDNFASIVKAVMWGRSVFDNIRKFLQFQLTVNVVALTLTFLSAVFGFSPPLNAVMMLWVNLIMDTMGALALGTELPTEALLCRRPYRRDASLITRPMMRNIAVQSLFQIALLGYLLLGGEADLGVATGSTAHYTVIFNVFVFCQVFNELNARNIEHSSNVLTGLHKNPTFLGIIVATIVTQVVLVQYGGDFVKTSPLSVDQWISTILLGAMSLPVGALMRCLPASEDVSQFAAVPKVQPQKSSGTTNALLRRPSTVDDRDMHVSSGASFYVWMLVVAAIPAAVVARFYEVWRGRLELMGSS